MQLFSPETPIYLALLAGVATAQSVQSFACNTAPVTPAPQGLTCNVKGTLGPNAASRQISATLGNSLINCATLCLANPNCQFAGSSDGACTLYNAPGNQLGFTASSTSGTTYFNRNCYFNPTSCTFKLRCPAGSSCAGKTVAFSIDNSAGAAYYPSAFVTDASEDANKRTTLNLTNEQYLNYPTITQGGKTYELRYPSADPFTQGAIIYFGVQPQPGNSYGAACTVVSRDRPDGSQRRSTFQCPQGEYDKVTFFACDDAARGRQTLRYQRPGFYNPPCLGQCFKQDIVLEAYDYVGRR